MLLPNRINKTIFLGHSSITCIKQNSSVYHFPYLNVACLTNPNETLKLLKERDTKMAIGFDMILSKALKIITHVLYSHYVRLLMQHVGRCFPRWC